MVETYIIENLISLVFTLIGFIGVIKRKNSVLRIYIVYLIIDFVFSIFITVLIANSVFVLIISILIGGGIELYIIFVLNAYHDQIKNEQKEEKEFMAIADNV